MAAYTARTRRDSCRWIQRPIDGIGILQITTATGSAEYEIAELRDGDNLASGQPWPDAFRVTRLTVDGAQPTYNLSWTCRAVGCPLACSCPCATYRNKHEGCKHARAVYAAYRTLAAREAMIVEAGLEALLVDEPGEW